MVPLGEVQSLPASASAYFVRSTKQPAFHPSTMALKRARESDSDQPPAKRGYYPASKTDKWQTPPALYNALYAEFSFDCDPCPIDWQPGMPDGLAIEWGQSTFCNPPDSAVGAWIAEAHQ